jgi:hypothetical protein
MRAIPSICPREKADAAMQAADRREPTMFVSASETRLDNGVVRRKWTRVDMKRGLVNARNWVGNPQLLAGLISGYLALLPTSAPRAESTASSQAGAPAADQFAPPYPFTGAQIWEKLSKIVRAPNRDMSPATVDHVFDVHLIALPPTTGQHRPITSTTYKAIAGVDSYFDIVLSVNTAPPFSILSFGWNHFTEFMNYGRPMIPEKLCVRQEMIQQTLNNNGLSLASSFDGHYVHTTLFKSAGRANATVVYPKGNACMLYFAINKNIAF